MTITDISKFRSVRMSMLVRLWSTRTRKHMNIVSILEHGEGPYILWVIDSLEGGWRMVSLRTSLRRSFREACDLEGIAWRITDLLEKNFISGTLPLVTPDLMANNLPLANFLAQEDSEDPP